MLAISVHFLADRYVASEFNDRQRVEWPPHPARLFSALVAAWKDDHDGRSHELAEERNALEWLESLEAPVILAAERVQIGEREVVPVFVPVNDVSVTASAEYERVRAKLSDVEQRLASGNSSPHEDELAPLRARLADVTAKAILAPAAQQKSDAARGRAMLPDTRVRQQRAFPSAYLPAPRVIYQWEATPVPAQLDALRRLSARLHRLGHSSSFVHAQCHGGPDDLNIDATGMIPHVPDEVAGRHVIRWVARGQVAALEEAFGLHQETEPRILPARFVRYRTGRAEPPVEPPQGVFGHDLLVFARADGPRLPITSVVGIASQLRRALLSVAVEPVSELLSGHTPDGSPSTHPHVAFVPLPHVFGPYADGAILGVALLMPRDATPAERASVMHAVGSLERLGAGEWSPTAPSPIDLQLGSAGVLRLLRLGPGDDALTTLRAETWCAAARHWGSVTPVALDRNPGDLAHSDPLKRSAAILEAEEIVRRAITDIGLPADDVRIDVLRSVVVSGSAKPNRYPRFPVESSKPQRVLVHVRLEFPQPVAGPIVLGAGRYRGLGLCLPTVESNWNAGGGE